MNSVTEYTGAMPSVTEFIKRKWYTWRYRKVTNDSAPKVDPTGVWFAKVVSVYDGDTVWAYFDSHKHKLRLTRINAPELRGDSKEEGLRSRDALRDLIQDKVVKVTVTGVGKFGRLLSELDLGGVNVNTWMVDNGYAEWYTV